MSLLARLRNPQSHTPSGIRGMTADSRKVEQGYLFAALPGVKVDGRNYITDALAAGATTILAPTGTTLPPDSAATLIEDDNPRRRFAEMAAAFYFAQPETTVAVTGTNGKTSTVNYVQQVWKLLGRSSASMGTLGVASDALTREGSLTTPDPVSLFSSLHDLCEAGVSHAALEASSHGLDQERLCGLRIKAAGFLNLSRDHLDYHGTEDAYFLSKAKLFTDILPADGTAVLNADDPRFTQLAAVCKARGQTVLSFGNAHTADARIEAIAPKEDGLLVRFHYQGQSYSLHTAVVGDFQAYNLLCAFLLVLASGETDVDRVVSALAQVKAVRGRLELVARHPQTDAPIFVDYAHTPDALERVLKACRHHTVNRLIAIFGCGGDRDAGKRPQMGRIAEELADVAIVTDDNPRTEDPETIRNQIVDGFKSVTKAMMIGSRTDAIRQGVRMLEVGDLLVIAGKGHEPGQIVSDGQGGTTVIPFDDAETARDAVKELA